MGVFRRRFFAIATVLAAVALAAEPGLARSVNISSSWLLPRNDFPVFYRHFRDRVTWFEADAVCQFHHAQLATVESNNQFEAIHGYLKELDVTENVWIGLKRNSEASEFTWTNYQPLARGGYFREEVPRSSDPVCVVADPTANFKWHSLHCGGPEVASFVCELPVPYWASKSNGCMTSMMEGMTVTFLPESPAIQLTKECYPGYSKNVTCKGNMKPSEIIEKLSCAGSNKLLKAFKPLKAVLPDIKSTTTTTTTTTSSSAESDLEDYAIEMATISQYNDETFQSISKVMGRGSNNMPQEMSIALEPIKSSARGGFDTNGIDSAYMGGISETTVSPTVASANAKVASASTTAASTSTTTVTTNTATTASTTVGAAVITKTQREPTTNSAVDPATVATTKQLPSTKTAVTFTTATVVVPVTTATVTATAAATAVPTTGPGKSALIQATTTTMTPKTSAENISTLTTSQSRPTTTVKTTTFAGTTAVAGGHHHHHHHRQSASTTAASGPIGANAPTTEKVRTVAKTPMTTTADVRRPVATTATPTSVVTPTVVPVTGSDRRPITTTTAAGKVPYTIATTDRRAVVQQQYLDDVTTRVPTSGSERREQTPVAETPRRVYKKIDLPVVPQLNYEAKPVAGTAATVSSAWTAAAATIAGNIAVTGKPVTTGKLAFIGKQFTAPATVANTATSQTATAPTVGGSPDNNNSTVAAASEASDHKNLNPTTSSSPSASPTADVATAADTNDTATTKTAATDVTSAATDVTTTPTAAAAAATAITTAANNPHRKIKNYDAFTEHPNRSRHIGRPKQQHHHTYPYILYRLLG